MAVITDHRLISHQDYSTIPSLRRLVRIDENSKWITHYIDFVLTPEQKLRANVVHIQASNFQKMPQVEISEDKIFYLADRTKVEFESGLAPGSLPFYQAQNREIFFSNLHHRRIEVIDIQIDHPFYERIAQGKNPNPVNNKTYILMAPAPEGPAPSLHFSLSASLPPEATPSASLEPKSPLKLLLESSLEASPDPTPPVGEGKIVSPTAYQEFD
jgi:hypothetical protein